VERKTDVYGQFMEMAETTKMRKSWEWMRREINMCSSTTGT
jgi:hypothetical protein